MAGLTTYRCIAIPTKLTLATEKTVPQPNEGLLPANIGSRKPFSTLSALVAVQASARLWRSLPIRAAVKLDPTEEERGITSSFPGANQVKGEHLSFIGFSFQKRIFMEQALL